MKTLYLLLILVFSCLLSRAQHIDIRPEMGSVHFLFNKEDKGMPDSLLNMGLDTLSKWYRGVMSEFQSESKPYDMGVKVILSYLKEDKDFLLNNHEMNNWQKIKNGLNSIGIKEDDMVFGFDGDSEFFRSMYGMENYKFLISVELVVRTKK